VRMDSDSLARGHVFIAHHRLDVNLQCVALFITHRPTRITDGALFRVGVSRQYICVVSLCLLSLHQVA